MSELYCGIDWAEAHHDVALLDADGQLVAKQRISEISAGFAELLDVLAAAGDSAGDPIPVAIETPRGLLVAALRATGRPVYPINPMAVARYRERHTASRGRSPTTSTRCWPTSCAPTRTCTASAGRHPLVRAIAVLARAHQDATWRRASSCRSCGPCCASITRLFGSVRRAQATNLATADARAVLAIAPTPAAAGLTKHGSMPRCGGPGATAVAAADRSTACVTRSCARPRSKTRWAPRLWLCWT